MHKWHIFPQFVALTCFRSCLTIIRVRCYRVSNTTTCAFVQGIIVYKYILHNPDIVWYVWVVENIFINNYTLYECTHRYYSVTAHPDDGQTRPKTCKCYKLRKYMSFVHFCWFSSVIITFRQLTLECMTAALLRNLLGYDALWTGE
jgi:hypothetical protein